MTCSDQFFGRKIDEKINQQNVSAAQALLLSALHSYMWALLDTALVETLKTKPYLLHCNFECLITCRYACAGKLEERCILQRDPETSEDQHLQDVVIFGHQLNAERNNPC